MYGYESSLDYTPATEGALKDWASKIGSWIREQGRKIRSWMQEVATNIKMLVKREKTGASSASDAKSLIRDIDHNIVALLDACISDIDRLRSEYSKVQKSDKDNYAKHRGMDEIKDAKTDADKDDIKNWNEVKISLAASFKNHATTASKIKLDLNKLTGFKNLDISTLKAGYVALHNIFDENGKFSNSWNVVVLAHDWSSGEIRSYLGKVVQLYKTGINATNVFASKLIKAKTEAGSTYKTETGVPDDYRDGLNTFHPTIFKTSHVIKTKGDEDDEEEDKYNKHVLIYKSKRATRKSAKDAHAVFNYNDTSRNRDEVDRAKMRADEERRNNTHYGRKL